MILNIEKGGFQMDRKIRYRIIDIDCVGDDTFFLGYNPDAECPYVTWKNSYHNKMPYLVHFFWEKETAQEDFEKRVLVARLLEGSVSV